MARLHRVGATQVDVAGGALPNAIAVPNGHDDPGNAIVDGLVRLVGAVTQIGGAIVSLLQSGRVRFYLTLSAGLVVIVLLYKVIL